MSISTGFPSPDQVEMHLLEHERKADWSMVREYHHYDYHAEEQRIGCQNVITMAQTPARGVADEVLVTMMDTWALPCQDVPAPPAEVPIATAR